MISSLYCYKVIFPVNCCFSWKKIHRELLEFWSFILHTMYSSGYSNMQPAKAKTLLKYVDQFPWRWSALMNKVLEIPFSLVGNLKE